MAQKHLWLSISLYCNKEQWNRLLVEGIHPFVNRLIKEKRLKYYHLELNYSGGENIRLPLFVHASNAERIAKYVDDYYRSFFSNNVFPKKEIPFPCEGIFMPFPANSIQYGLYSQEELAADEINNIFQQYLSDLLIDILGEDTIDDETVLTLSFYLHLSLLKVINENGDVNFHELLETPRQLLPEHKQVIDTRFIEEKFSENKVTLLEIARDIMQSTDNLPDWINAWKHNCEVRIKKRNLQYLDVRKKKQLYQEMALLINKQLGFNENMRLVLFYFLEQVLSIETNSITDSTVN